MRALAVLLLAGLLSSEEPPSLHFSVERVVLAQELRLGTDGGQELGLLVLVLRARAPSGVTVLGYGPPTVDQARSDAGEDCAPAPTGEEPGGGLRLLRRADGVGDGDPPLILRLTPPPRPRFRLARCAGTVEVRWRSGTITVVGFPGQAPAGTVLELPQVDQGAATVTAHDGDDVRLGWPETVDQRIRVVRFEAADGSAIAPRRRGVLNQEGHVVRTFGVALPAGSRIVIEIQPPEQTARIPFAVDDVALPGVGAMDGR